MPAALDDMRAYARRFCLQLNGLLHHAGQELEAAIQVLPRSTGIQVCRFHTGRWDRTGGNPRSGKSSRIPCWGKCRKT